MRVFFVLTLATLLASAVMAADVTGKWTAQVPGRDGQTREQTFNLKAEGDKLTGTVSGGQGGDTAIADGKISGDTISFTVTREMGGNTMKFVYTGSVAGDEIKFKREGGPGQPREFTAKRVK
jgi:opacity protein-like surface antigen